ncbi:streptomycin 6-kinase [Auraticoccus monumenti]|uniref:Streptomycin 6-kinase n=1 Tax=Auraticoccus monumenti TaxID=675864 RepID=A0A1G7AEW5_9ACTN|nr:streptomycin 6-kinase [Auraticoccus monumenti]
MWPTEAAWRATVPALVERCVARWGLELGAEYSGGTAAFVARARTADGVDAVLKVSLPHREARDEAEALRRWDGRGAVRLLARDEDEPFALLLERCEPGTTLASRDDLTADARLEVAAGLLSRLWGTAGPVAAYETVGAVAAEWADLLEERMRVLAPPFDPGLVARGASLLRALPGTATREVVVHGDYNPGNVLAATREPWLVIDPKPMLGDPGYDLCPLLVQVDDPFLHAEPTRVLRERVDLLAASTGEPAERVLAWAVARMVEAALWFVSRSELDAGREDLRRAEVLLGLLEG